MYRVLLMTAVLFLKTIAFSQTSIYLIPSLHELHKENIQYNYDSLNAIIQRINPDVIAVELRKEDIAADTAYLKQNYPYEMWMMRYWFPRATIEGFDWLGKELEGQPIPNRYWQDRSRIKALQQLLNIDTVFSKKLSACQVYTDERSVLLHTKSLKGLLQSNDAILIKAYYDCLTQHLRGSEYEELTSFHELRHQQMMQRLQTIIADHPNKKIVILTGDDHTPYLRGLLNKKGIILLRPY